MSSMIRTVITMNHVIHSRVVWEEGYREASPYLDCVLKHQ